MSLLFAPAAPHAGSLLREWRMRRRRSQMDLALHSDVSPRHLSFVETGRARPSAALLLALAEQLQLPLRERNRLLLAAGYAPRFAEQGLDAQAMAPVRAALQRLMAAHHPYPGLVLDRHWNVLLANDAALRLAELLPASLREPQFNVFRASLHPEGLAKWTLNFEAWGAHLLRQLQQLVAQQPDAATQALLAEVSAYPTVRALQGSAAVPAAAEEPTLLLPCVLALPQGRLSMFTTLSSFGTPRDITLDELCVELFYPADAASEALLRAAG